MTENFGKQFTFAREALGLSTKDVASKIKIREEYILDIENNKFDFPLPSIYIRGFIRNYARLLKLDVDVVMSQCPVPEFKVSDSIKHHSGDFVEHIKSDTSISEDISKKEHNKLDETISNVTSWFKNFKSKLSVLPQRKLLIGGGILLSLILCIVLVFVLNHTRNSFDVSGIVPVEAESIATKSIVLSATGNVNVVVRNKGSLEKIYSGTLTAGVVKSISYYKTVQIFYDHGEFLLIQQDNGERVYPQPGRGGVEIK